MKAGIIFLWIILSMVSIILLLFRDTERYPSTEKYRVIETSVNNRTLDIRMRKATKEEIEENRKAIENERIAEGKQ